MAFSLRKPPIMDVKHDAYPYQLDAVRAVASLPYAAIFHEQGLGKTKIAIDLFLLWLKRDVVDTVFVVTKKTLVHNWVDEIGIHSYVTPHVLSVNRRRNSVALNSPVLVYVLHYEVVSGNADLIRQFLATCRVGVILDESQKIKNPLSRLASCFHDLSRHFCRRIIVTGTPVANRPFDIWSQIKFLDGGTSLGTSFDDFKKSLDLPRGAGGTEYSSRLSGVMTRIRPFAVRETKHTAGLDLPTKTVISHEVRLAPRQAEIYEMYKADVRLDIAERGDMQDVDGILTRLLRLVQCASNPRLVYGRYTEQPGKYSRLLDVVADAVKSSKVVVWTGFIGNVEWLGEVLASYRPAQIHGKMPTEERVAALSMFKTSADCRILLATPGAAKEGLTLTVANHAIFFDRSFSLDDYIQAQDRIHRISQTKECFVHNLVAKDTIDEWVDALLNAKYQAAQLTQGDISVDHFRANYRFDLAGVLRDVLTPTPHTLQ